MSFDNNFQLLDRHMWMFDDKECAKNILYEIKLFSEHIDSYFECLKKLLRLEEKMPISSQPIETSGDEDDENSGIEDSDPFNISSIDHHNTLLNKKKESKCIKKISAEDSFWQKFKFNEADSFSFDNNQKIYAINGIDQILLEQNVKKCEYNYAAAIVVNNSLKYSPNVVITDFQSLYPTSTILNNIDSSSISFWSEFKIYIKEQNIYVDPFDERFIKREACQLKINNVYTNVLIFFIRPNISKSITSMLQINLSKQRERIKKILKLNDLTLADYNFYDAGQLAIKRIMNSIYGATASNFYNVYLINVSSQITKKSRNQFFSFYMYSFWYWWKRGINTKQNFDIVYGDTDSFFSTFKDKYSLPKSYIIKLAYEYKRYPKLNSYYSKDLLPKETNKTLNEDDYRKFVLMKWNLDEIKDYDCELQNWQIVGDNSEFLDEQDYLFNVEKYKSSIDDDKQQIRTLQELLSYNKSENKWKTFYEYLSLEPRIFDNSFLYYVQMDIIHKYSFLPRNRTLLPGKKWSDLVFSNREFDNELIGSINIDKISELIVIINIERLIKNFFLFSKKNYIGNASDGLYSKGGGLFNQKQSTPTKSFINSIWRIFEIRTNCLESKQLEYLNTAFLDYLNYPDHYFEFKCKIGKELDDYKATNCVWLNQLKLVNRLSLNKISIDDYYDYSFYNYFFQEPLIGIKIDTTNQIHCKILKNKKQCNLLVGFLVDQVKQDVNDQDLENFSILHPELASLNKSELKYEAQKFYFKFGITDLKLDKEMILKKDCKNPIEKFTKIINLQEGEEKYYKNFEQEFERCWNFYFGSSFFNNKIKHNKFLKILDEVKKNANDKRKFSNRRRIDNNNKIKKYLVSLMDPVKV